MKRLLLLAAVLTASSLPGFAAWSRVNVVQSYCDGTAVAACSSSITPAAAGNLLVAVAFYNNSSTSIASACSGASCTGSTGGWVHPSSCKASQPSNYTMDMAYTLSAITGTGVTVTFSANAAYVDLFVMEYTGGTAPFTFDGCALGSTTTSATAQNGGSITTTGANDVAVVAFSASADYTTPAFSPSPWSASPLIATNGPEALDEALNFSARTTQAILTNGAAITSVAATIAFKDSTAASSFKPRLFTPIIISMLWPELIQ